MTVRSTIQVPVRGGLMAVGIWDSDDVAGGAAPRDVVLALHGITATHQSWPLVAERLAARAGMRVVAPDLRGRGRSNHLPGPWGMATHAEDAASVLASLGAQRALVIGHSMGGFVAVVFAHRYPHLTSSIVLIDGGLPMSIPPGMSQKQILQATLGPAAARLAMTFESRQAYQEFWRAHPALGPDWSKLIAQYVDYDLVGEEPELRSSASHDAVAADSTDLHTGTAFHAAWDALAHDALFLRAPLGLLAEPPGLYPPAEVKSVTARAPRLHSHEIDGVNHYTITMSELGADRVAAEVSAMLDASLAASDSPRAQVHGATKARRF